MIRNGFSASRLFEHMSAEALAGAYLAKVTSVQDPENLARVQVRLLSFDGVPQQDGAMWARVALPFAGSHRGVFMLPDVGDEVLVAFVNGDSRFPAVIGGLWNGNAQPPDKFDGAEVDRWVIKSKAGTKIGIFEKASGQPTISLETPGGVTGTLTDEAGGKIELSLAGGMTTITMDATGVSIQTGSNVQVQASEMEVTAGQVTVNACVSTFSGMITCDVLQATTVSAGTYTPGVGNVW
jgi:uncharacterized protein involved in type VI secretion and phage assembly